VHASGIPWNDPSGDRLRLWLEMPRETFYDERRIAIVPMGLCYPGRLPNGGDAPPRRECAPLWHTRLIGRMPRIRLTLLVGSYAQNYVLGRGAPVTPPGMTRGMTPGKTPGNTPGMTMTERVQAFRQTLPRYFPLPHPSWRTTAWERRNPWFAAEVLPALRQAVSAALFAASP
jgi:uracil-DNA glycosylase